MGHSSGGQRFATRWVDRSLRAKGLVVVAVPITILVVVLAATLWFTHVDNRAQDLSGHARQVVEAATTLENSLLSAQTGIGAYLLTGESAFRTSFARAQDVIPGQMAQLSTLTQERGERQAGGDAIQRDADRLVFDMSQLALQSPTHAPTGVVRALLHFTQVETARLRADVAVLADHENAVIASQRASINLSSSLLPAIAIAAAVLAVGGGVIVSQLFTSGVVTRLRRLEKATASMEHGEVPEEVPIGRDEIGRLSGRLLDSATQLRERARERDRAREELEDILTASPVVSLCYDVAARRFSYASPNIERLLGISAKTAMADPQAVLGRFHTDTAHQLRDLVIGGAGRDGKRFEFLARFRTDPGSDQWREADAVYSVEVDADGDIHSVIAYLVDVSERHEAQRAAEDRRLLLESIFHASPDTIVVRDVAGRAVLTSSALAEVIGVTDHEPRRVVERAYGFGDVSRQDRTVLEDLIARCVAGETSPEPVVTTGRLPDGDVRTFETRARPVFDQAGRVTGTVTVSRDVTDRVRLEQSLRLASTASERASEAKSEFLSRMSHELRTPLNAILGFAQLLELDDLPEHQASSLDQIQLAGRHLLSLINEVLDISRIEAGRLTLSTEPVDVGDVLDEVAALLSPVAESTAVALSVDIDGARAMCVQADRQRLLQVLLNLGSNAVKYTGRGGSVAFVTGDGDSGRVRFEVRDTGPGIPYEQQDQLFVPFSRLGAERSAVEGTGVGLALSKQLVEVMGGSIGVESTPGRGSTFWVELLRAAEAAPAPTLVRPGANGSGAAPPHMAGGGPPGVAGATAGSNGQGESHHANGGLVVLHIEDNPSNASLVERVLAKRSGVHLVSAFEGRSGLELARRHRPDLVLLDLHLPDLPGDVLLHRLKAVPELADTKVVVVSADATPSRIREMLDLGVERYLTKPVDVEALLQLVDHEIGARQA
jgi:PAS domain S-box-containing protein